jgi:hypothetical protein
MQMHLMHLNLRMRMTIPWTILRRHLESEDMLLSWNGSTTAFSPMRMNLFIFLGLESFFRNLLWMHGHLQNRIALHGLNSTRTSLVFTATRELQMLLLLILLLT